MYIIVDTPDIAANKLNSDLDKIHSWSSKWLVDFNPAKTESVLFSRKRNQQQHPQLFLNNTIINEVNNHRHLGLILSCDLSWDNHVDNIISKVVPKLNVLRKLKFQLDRVSLRKIYFSHIRPVLEYADVVWDFLPVRLLRRLENINLEAARIITGATKYVSHQSLYSELNLESLSDRRRKHRLILFYKIVNGLTPSYLTELLPSQHQDTHTYPTRSRSNFMHLHSRTNLYRNSFFPQTVRDWNNLPEYIRSIPSLSSFKSYLFKDKSEPPYYNIGNRKSQIHHARLRMNCSPLKSTLFQKNLVESPFCSCNSNIVETTKHFLLDCPKYSSIRNSTLDLLPYDTNLETLLYGNENLSCDENSIIFRSVQKYIHLSKRFEQN